MVLGDDEGVPEQIVDDFRRSGLLHIMAVSGENVVLLCAMWSFALMLFGVPRAGADARPAADRRAATCSSPGPRRRSCAPASPASPASLAILVSRPADGWLVWLVPGAWLLTVNPNNLFDVSFQLSFAAVAGLLLLSRPLTRALRFLPGPLAEQAGVTTAASIATDAGVDAHLRVDLGRRRGRQPRRRLRPRSHHVPRHALAPRGVRRELAVAAAQSSSRASSSASCSRCPASSGASRSPSTSGRDRRSASCSRPPSCPSSSPCGCSRGRQRGEPRVATRPGRRTGRGSCSSPRRSSGRPLLLAPVAPAAPSVPTLRFLSVGRGGAALLHVPDGPTILIDAGPDPLGLRLQRLGVGRVDLVVLSHGHADHVGGLADVVARLRGALRCCPAPTSRRRRCSTARR